MAKIVIDELANNLGAGVAVTDPALVLTLMKLTDARFVKILAKSEGVKEYAVKAALLTVKHVAEEHLRLAKAAESAALEIGADKKDEAKL